MTLRTLILSGGGGRGVFHAGVYKYLQEADKPTLDADHRGPWQPDIVVGTSIGAVNGAAITQGLSAQELEDFWLSLRENNIQGLPPGMRWLARRVVNRLLRRSIGTGLHRVSPENAFSPTDVTWDAGGPISNWFTRQLIGQFGNLLDTGPLYQTLMNRLKLDPDRIEASATQLLISATNVRTGEGVFFCNHTLRDPDTGEPFPYLREGITLRRIVASCSIPLVYPWTQDDDGSIYWDGAVIANTPLGPAFDAARTRPINEPMEVVVVIMTPWWEKGETAPARAGSLPQDLGQAVTWTLDWAMLATFRNSLRLARQYNRLREAQLDAGMEPTYRRVQDVIVAPPEFLPVERIIDYDEPASRALIAAGYDCAKQAFEAKFGG